MRSAASTCWVLVAKTSTSSGVSVSSSGPPTTGHVEADVLVGRTQAEPVAAQGLEVRAAGDQDDGTAGLVQATADRPSDGPGPDDDVAVRHPATLAGPLAALDRLARCRSRSLMG